MSDETFKKWLSHYTIQFASTSNSALKGYWYMHGQESEQTATPREMAAWVAVNQEIEFRGL